MPCVVSPENNGRSLNSPTSLHIVLRLMLSGVMRSIHMFVFTMWAGLLLCLYATQDPLQLILHWGDKFNKTKWNVRKHTNESEETVNKKLGDILLEKAASLIGASHPARVYCTTLRSELARTRLTHRTSLLIQLALIPVRRNFGVGFVDRRRFWLCLVGGTGRARLQHVTRVWNASRTCLSTLCAFREACDVVC